MVGIRYYESYEVLEMLEDWRARNFQPNYKVIAKRLGTGYTYFIAWKNGDRKVSQEFLHKIVNFVNEN